MAIFFKPSTDSQTCNQCFYVKEKHDLYKWNYPAWPESEPIFGSLTQPGQWGGLYPNAYNTSCYINDGPYVPDLSGKSTRARQYGWAQSGNWYHFFGRPTCIPANPESSNQSQIDLIKNIGNWNFGFATSLFISPRHFITTKHAFNANIPELSVNVLFKNNTSRWVRGVNVFPTNPFGEDIILFRLDAADTLQPEVDSGLIAIYNDYFDLHNEENINYLTRFSIFDWQSMDRYIAWRVEGGERIIRGVLNAQVMYDFLDNRYLNYDISDYSLNLILTNNGKTIDDYQSALFSVFVGDSGSPNFVYDINSGKTILMGLNRGAEMSHVYKFSTNGTISPYDRISQELANYGYSLNEIDVNTVRLMTVRDYFQEQENTGTPSFSSQQANTFTNVSTPPLYRYPYSSRIYTP